MILGLNLGLLFAGQALNHLSLTYPSIAKLKSVSTMSLPNVDFSVDQILKNISIVFLQFTYKNKILF
jgi:hypothetical protein